MFIRKIFILGLLVISNITLASKDSFYLSLKGGNIFDTNGLSQSQAPYPANDTVEIVDTINAKASFEFEDGFRGGVELGRSFEVFRIGVEATYSKSNMKSGEIIFKINDEVELYENERIPQGYLNILNFGANLYLDIRMSDIIVPYIGVGIGYSNVKLADDEKVYKSLKDYFQVMFGSQFFIRRGMSITLEYKFFQTGKFKYIDADFGDDDLIKFDDFKDNVITHSLNVGINLFFG
ncbi:MAG: porin family protein [Legionellales bacterium]|nr:porin family protein [Legionellales bacterium]